MEKNKSPQTVLKNKTDYPVVLTVEHVTEILGVSKRVAYEIMDRKDFPLKKVGRLKRVSRDLFFQWLEKAN